MINKCKFCAGQHLHGSCPAYSRTCSNCNQKGHYSFSCTRQTRDTKTKRHQKRDFWKKVQEVNDDSTDSNSYFEEFFIGEITLDDPESHVVVDINDSDPPPLLDEYYSDYNYESSNECSTSDISSSDLSESLSVEPVGKDWTIDLETNRTDVTHKINSGAQADVIPLGNRKKRKKERKEIYMPR